LNKILKEGVVLRVTNVLVDGDSAVVETESLSTALNGKPFNNRYCWIVRFSDGTIVEVRAYLDSALVERLIDENEPSVGQQEQKSR
jgi:ketosteroid isomerase-like protein